MEAPKSKKDIQKLTGRVAALNIFVSRVADRCFPFFKVLRGNQIFEWNDECDLAFQQLKQTLAIPPVLAKPGPGDTLFLYLAVSRNAVSGVLVKEKGKVQQPIYYVITARKLRQYFQSHPIIVLTNQPLKHILQRPDVSGRLLRWAIELDSSGSGAGIIIISPDKATEVQCALRFEFEATNNEAEYEAVVIALELARSLELEHIRVFSNSQLVVGQIEGSLKGKMSLHCVKVHDLQRQFTSCEILTIARADNSKADALSRLVFMRIDGLDRTVHVKIVTEPIINAKPRVMDIDQEPSWIDPIVEYISNGNLPPDPRTVRSIRAKAASYLKPSESLQPPTEVHEGICENHQGARALAYKLIRYGYHWPTIKKDAAEYVKRCDKCQRFGNAIHVPIEELTSIHYSAPFEQWGVDILRPFPMARGQLKFVVVTVEYFTKWVEAKLRSFVWKSIVCRFGIPKVLITDNGRQFDNSQFRNFCVNLGIDHCLTSVSHPQSNGLAEVTNRIILQDLRIRIGNARGDWPDELPSILWVYRTSHKTATGETPFMLAFGLEATIPVEVSLPTLRRVEPSMEDQTTEHLDLLEEVREQASLRAASYQNKIAKYFNTKVKSREFRSGDLVLRRAEVVGHPPGKLGRALSSTSTSTSRIELRHA
ncbi:uncharacterized protein LOC111365514 [Olea europaea var. sylvestris]|uniref:uncharacterized protein LOC111365514 n=1 Tax=Olea europaea var. sylvestris TaxID=158386 RepID=UPI000C1D1172|nr:uncharacterized protein LOC111365514 [Olea europaea var. sylvestris]